MPRLCDGPGPYDPEHNLGTTCTEQCVATQNFARGQYLPRRPKTQSQGLLRFPLSFSSQIKGRVMGPPLVLVFLHDMLNINDCGNELTLYLIAIFVDNEILGFFVFVFVFVFVF